MSGNTIGTIFKVTTFGESHGAGLGVVIDGCPAGLTLKREQIQRALDRRRPGARQGQQTNAAVTARSEPDQVEIISGVFQDVTEGTPIALLIRNTAQHSSDYGNLAHTFRPGHADYTYYMKYGVRDYRGGGRSSGRETASRVAAGAVAQALLDTCGIQITAYTERAAGISISSIDPACIEQNAMRAPDNNAAQKMLERIEALRKDGDSAGGIVACRITGVPAGLGEPVFDKLDAELAKSMLSIGAVKGIEFGAGFAAADLFGSTDNDIMRTDGSSVQFGSNNAGGTLGGISNGNDIVFRLAVKPVPSIFKSQQTVSAGSSAAGAALTDTDLTIQGRHDVCLCPRIVPVVEAMAQITIADMLLRQRAAKSQ